MRLHRLAASAALSVSVLVPGLAEAQSRSMVTVSVPAPAGFDRATAQRAVQQHLERLIGLDTQNPPGNELLTARYRHHYFARDQQTLLFEGAALALAELERQGFLLAVATGKGRNGLNRSLADSGIAHHIHASRCADECFSKPHPQMLLEIMDELGVEAERTLMVGDTSYDLQMACNANVASLGVCYGAHAIEDLLPHAPLAHFDQFTKLNQWLIMNA